MAQQPPGEGQHFSTDRQWWWNGTDWVPASQAPQQPPTPPTPPPAPAPPGRRRRWPWVVGGLAALLVVFSVCVAAVANSPSNRPTAEATIKPTQAARATQVPAAQPPTTPDPRGTCSPQPCANDNYGWIVVISDVKYGAQAGNQFEKPEAGNVFVTLNATFTNKLAHEQHANPTEFVLLDGAGIKHTTTFISSCEIWSPVNVTAGATYGPKCIAFQAAADKLQGLTLVWTPQFAGGDYRIKLS